MGTPDNELYNYFSKYGDIVNCKSIMNPATGKSRGFAFITFSAESSVASCLEEGVHALMGKVVEVKRAVVKEKPKMPYNR